MRPLGLCWLIALTSAISSVHAVSNNIRLGGLTGPQAANFWKLNSGARRPPSTEFAVQSNDGSYTPQLTSTFEAHYFRQPLDHFDKSSGASFLQRYWVNTRHYNSQGESPVIVLDGGESDGEERLPFLDTGIVDILAKATGGIGVVLEHRYYGRSIPVLNFSTDSLRWLNNAQSAADSANFMANVEFPGIEKDMTAPNTPWIYYGGSYAGARAAHMKILYPELVYGAVASSGVTHASHTIWEYFDIIRKAADPKCSSRLESAIKTIDEILPHAPLKRPLKALFGLADLEHDDDFVSVLTWPLFSWQMKCWDPAFDSDEFDGFCEALSRPPFGLAADAIPYGHGSRAVRLPGGLTVDFAVLNYGKYIREKIVSQCPRGQTVEECFGTYNDAKFRDDTLDQDWRLWIFQSCTEWGYFPAAPPDSNQPRIVSKLLRLEYSTRICPQAFPPGKYYQIPQMPNITAVNELGDFGIAADRLAIIDGEVDPWRFATPHSESAEDREDTVLRPFKIIPDAVHHYDEYGYKDLEGEPPEIRRIHEETISFVRSWLDDWTRARGR